MFLVIFMDILHEKYIILEIIPTTSRKETGDIAQISALKLDGLQLIERFDYRLKKEKILNPFVLEMISYDEDKFTQLNTTKSLLETFEVWSEGLPILILNNNYTNSYLSDLKNEKRDICTLLNISYSDDIIAKLITKYNLRQSNYIVDLLYESLLQEF